MTERYSFTWHPAEQILEVALTGLWTLDEVEPYYAALTDFAGRNASEQFMVLTDLTGYPVQRPEVADLHSTILAMVQHNSPVTREAWVVAGVVAKMQASRGADAGEQEVNIFTDRTDAWSYLTHRLVS